MLLLQPRPLRLTIAAYRIFETLSVFKNNDCREAMHGSYVDNPPEDGSYLS
jgi:hypothetical protein